MSSGVKSKSLNLLTCMNMTGTDKNSVCYWKIAETIFLQKCTKLLVEYAANNKAWMTSVILTVCMWHKLRREKIDCVCLLVNCLFCVNFTLNIIPLYVFLYSLH
jgi:hypothetical protein